MTGDDEDFSADEAAFFSSGGEKTVAEAPKEEADAIEPDEPVEDDGEEPETEPVKAEDGKKSRTVPHQALHAERVKRQELEKTLSAEREKMARLDERVRLINEAMAQRNQPEPAAPPDPDADPIGALKHMREQLAEQQQREKAMYQQRQQEQQVSQLDDAYRRSFTDFAKATPDAVEAYNHVTGFLDNYFMARGITDAAQREQLIMQEERQIAAAALQQGISPAQVIYDQAKNMGWAPKQAETPAPDKIAAKQKAVAASRSMSNTGGSSTGDLSPESLANMDEDEFAEVMAKVGSRKLASLMGA